MIAPGLNMRNRHILLAVAITTLLALTAPTFAAETKTTTKTTKPYSPPRTADGKPDLQGVWANNNATPLERPKSLADRAFLTEQEVDALRKRQEEIFAGDGDAAFGDAIFEAVISDVQKYKPTTFDASTGNYNAFWLVERDFDNRTSLITDPSGRIPPTTDAAKQRMQQGAGRTRGGSDGPESRTLSERCITFGVPDLLAGYNSYYQIVQTPTAVVIHAEKIHDARIIPINAGPHAPAAVRSWLGDSRGKWVGDTLVVDTVNLKGNFRGGSDKLHLIEKFTRVGPNTIHYAVTVDDPATWTSQWNFMIPLKRTDDNIYEYACHEGNSSLAGILAGAREDEKVKK
jgi:hypothetical protein